MQRALLAFALVFAACGDEATDAPDAGPSSRPDATAADASGTDAGAPDALPGADAPAPDATATGPVSVTFVVTVPAGTSTTPPVHIAGDFQGWDPTAAAYALTARDARTQAITLTLEVGQSLAFKFARADWSRVEKAADGSEVPDRTVTITGSSTLTFTVARWADSAPTTRTLVGDMSETTVPGFLSDRRVWVYLPPGYATDTATSYPVLYMLDGQNLFDRGTSFAGEWQVDEALEAGIAAGEIAPVIVIGIDNGGAARIAEYTPWTGTGQYANQGGGGAAHLDAIVDVLKPWVDATYRTRPGRADTGLAGSSLGGLMAMYAAYAHPETFGRIGALSASIWWSGEELVDYVTAGTKPDSRVWIDMGTAEGETEPFRRLRDALLAAGFVEGQDLRAVEVPGAGHNEAAWAARMPQILRFLYAP